jgi:hypothetical protein
MQMELHEKEEDVQHIEHITKRYVPIDDGGASVSWINSANTSHGFVLEREARASTISSRSSSGRFAVNVSPSKVTSPSEAQARSRRKAAIESTPAILEISSALAGPFGNRNRSKAIFRADSDNEANAIIRISAFRSQYNTPNSVEKKAPDNLETHTQIPFFCPVS